MNRMRHDRNINVALATQLRRTHCTPYGQYDGWAGQRPTSRTAPSGIQSAYGRPYVGILDFGRERSRWLTATGSAR
jgi:hypothetical protein